jgi:hypothetical protein
MNQAAQSNGGPDGDQLNGYLDAIAMADDELLSLKSDYMTKCKTPRKKIRETMGSAKQAGMNMTALRELVREDREKRRRERRIAEMEADDLSDLQAMQVALGEFVDTPLGQAAMRRAGAGDNVLDTLRA